MLTLVFLPIAFALLLYIADRERLNRLSPYVILLEIPLAARLLYRVATQGEIRLLMGGYPRHIGIELLVDPLMAGFVLLGSILWLFSCLYAMTKWSGDSKYYFFFHFLRGAYYAFLFSNDLFNIFVLVELISLISAVLITYKKDGFAVRAGFYYLLFNSVGMVFYLLGIMVIYQSIGSLNLSDLVLMPDGTALKFSLSLMVVAFGVKSAFFPVYNWLPKAHAAAPTSISMLLSGLLVKSGFVGLIKVFRVLGSQGFTEYMLIIGTLTATVGFLFALSQKDLKMTLAFSTVSQSGLILMGLVGNEVVFVGGLLHLFNHALFKSALFLIAGVLIAAYNTRRIEEIRGIFQTMPDIAFVMMLAMLSITAMPFTNGYYSKALIAKGDYPLLIGGMIHVINIGTMVYFIKIAGVFRRDRVHEKRIQVPINKRIAIHGLGLLLILTAALEPWIMAQFADIEIAVSMGSFATFGIYAAVALLLNRLFVRKEHPYLYHLRHFRLSFADANILMMLFIITAVWFTL